jgi:hypothetical protein
MWVGRPYEKDKNLSADRFLVYIYSIYLNISPEWPLILRIGSVPQVVFKTDDTVSIKLMN